LMTGLQRLTSYPIALVRGSIEVTAVIVGAFLGAVVGIGTLFFSFGIGPALSTTQATLEQSISRGKQTLKIDRNWNSKVCDLLERDIRKLQR